MERIKWAFVLLLGALMGAGGLALYREHTEPERISQIVSLAATEAAKVCKQALEQKNEEKKE